MSEDAPPNRGVLWARTLVEEWARHGLRDVCVGSGSRSAPLVDAFARDPRFRLHAHVDERSAAFFALGHAVAAGRASAVVTTSGTAAANLLPAAVEASQAEIPLLLVTADRPPRVRGLDANQTIRQPGLFGGYPRLEIDLALPRATAGDLRLLRTAAARSWAAAAGVPRGPVHVNVPFEKPLEPTSVPGDVPTEIGAGRPGPDPWTRVLASRPAAAGAELAAALEGARRPVVVCGPSHDPADGPAALRLAAALRCPLVADPLSGARFAPGATERVVPHGDLVLADSDVAGALEPDAVVRVGPAPTSAAVQRYLARHAAHRQIVVDAGGRWKDHRALASDVLVTHPASTLAGAADEVDPAEGEWSERWRSVGRAAEKALAPSLAQGWFEGAVAAAAAAAVPAGATWFVGSSMPVRDVDAFAGPRDVPIRAFGLRGASGIDGSVSAALGAAAARPDPALALIGDLTLLHDVGALLFARSRDVRLQLLVIQNRGGGIFHMLPIREHDPPFTPYVVMPHDVDLAAVADAAGIPHRPVASVAAVREELEAGWERGGVRLLEAVVDREENWERRDAAASAAREAARAAL